MVIEIVAAIAIFAAGYKYGAYVTAKGESVLKEAVASAEAEVKVLKDRAASEAKALVNEVKSAI